MGKSIGLHVRKFVYLDPLLSHILSLKKHHSDFNQHYKGFQKAAIFDENKIITHHIVDNDLFYVKLPNGIDFDGDFNIAPLEPKNILIKVL